MIVTVTANPCVDLTLELDTLENGEVNRSLGQHKDPAGKGINVSRALFANGVDTVAVFPADRVIGAWIDAQLNDLGLATVAVPIRDEVRENITIAEGNGLTTKINAAGPVISATEQDALLGHITAILDTHPRWLVAAGSLPRGLDAAFYVRLGELAHERGVRFAVDTSGTALATVAQAGIADLLKPNLEELEELVGHPLTTVGEVVDSARALLGREQASILVSLGEHGALLITREHVAWAAHSPVTAMSTVGAGDSSLAGYLSADESMVDIELDVDEALLTRLRTAVAWGTAAVQLPGTSAPGPEDITIDEVHSIFAPDPSRSIKELRV
jgi:1-phosphofructokinase